MRHESMNIRRVIRANRLLAEQGHANDTLAALDEMAALRKNAQALRAVALELERLMLVIESAVRHSDPRNHAAVMALILANKAALAAAGAA